MGGGGEAKWNRCSAEAERLRDLAGGSGRPSGLPGAGADGGAGRPRRKCPNRGRKLRGRRAAEPAGRPCALPPDTGYRGQAAAAPRLRDTARPVPGAGEEAAPEVDGELGSPEARAAAEPPHGLRRGCGLRGAAARRHV